MRSSITTKIAGALLLAIVAVSVTFVVGMRQKSKPVRRGVRWLSKATRGFTVGSAGTTGAYASVVRHVGRRSGRAYETPVRATATDDGFVITLPYGSDTDWVKNVLAAGNATLTYEGATVAVDDPRIVQGTGDAQLFAAKDQRTQRLFGVDEYLHLHRC